jgi:hypothetical protein
MGPAALTVAQVAEQLGLLPSVAHRGLAYWIAEGVLAPQADGTVRVVETVVDETDAGTPAAAAPMLLGDMDDSGDGDAGGGDAAESEEEMRGYIVGMLQMPGAALAADVIHTRLRMFMETYDHTLPQLVAVLGQMVVAEQLEVRDGTYRLRRSE